MQKPSNYDLSALAFSNYKNTHTRRTFDKISPNDIGLVNS